MYVSLMENQHNRLLACSGEEWLQLWSGGAQWSKIQPSGEAFLSERIWTLALMRLCGTSYNFWSLSRRVAEKCFV